ncbi:MAG: bile acid:sodium symporter [Lachnospiraceae bacterium]
MKVLLDKFNRFIEKWMALVTPACLLFGAFPDIAKHGLPYVSLVFGLYDLTGALKSDFHDMARVLKHPIPLLACLGVLAMLRPVLACGLGHLLFPGNDRLITGMVLEFSVPTAVVSLMWVTIYSGNSPLSLSLVIVDTLISPFLIPATLQILVGSRVSMDAAGMMRELLFMIAIPALAAISLLTS